MITFLVALEALKRDEIESASDERAIALLPKPSTSEKCASKFLPKNPLAPEMNTSTSKIPRLSGFVMLNGCSFKITRHSHNTGLSSREGVRH